MTVGRALVAGLVWCSLAGLASAAPETEISGLTVGFGGAYKVGYWAPVVVTLKGGDAAAVGQLELSVIDAEGASSRVLTPANRPVQVAAGQSTRVTMRARFGRVNEPLRVRFIPESGDTTQREFQPGEDEPGVAFGMALPTDDRLYVGLGPDIGLASLASNSGSQDETALHYAPLTDARDLPTRWIDYEGVDAVVFSTSRPEIYTTLTDNSAALAALTEWIESGGKLILSAGGEAPTLLAAGGPLASFAPGTFLDVELLRQTRALETLAGLGFPDFAASREANSGLPVPRFDQVQGRIEARDGALSLVVRTARVFGEIVFVAVDLDRRPLADWPGREKIVQKLLDVARDDVADKPSGTRVAPATHLGLSDLSSQLRAALDQFAGVRLIPFWVVAGLVLIYILVIGPGDYFLLKRVLKRMELTWVTFPLAVVGFSLLGYFLAYQVKGRSLRINQVDLIDVDAESGRVRGTTWANIFSPRTATYDLSLKPGLPGSADPEASRVVLSWMGLPGSALGGMEPTTPGPRLFGRSYEFAPGLEEMRGVPIQVWSTRAFTARWSGQADSPVQADLQEDQWRLAGGTVTNGLSVPLTNCLLAYRESAYALGDIAAGEQVAVDPARQLGLADVLRDVKLVKEKRDVLARVSTQYNQAGLEVPAILRQMMFHEATGGQSYAGLANAYQGFTDLSGHLALGRAVFVATVPAADGEDPNASSGGPQLLDEGAPLAASSVRKWTIYRFVFTVRPAVDPVPTGDE